MYVPFFPPKVCPKSSSASQRIPGEIPKETPSIKVSQLESFQAFVIDSGRLEVKGGNSGFPARATLPPTRFLTWSKFLKNILSLHFLIWKMRMLELNGHLASRPLKIPGSGGTASRNTGKDVKKACTKSGLFPEQLLKIFTAAFLRGSKTEATSHSLLFLPFQKAECEVSQ